MSIHRSVVAFSVAFFAAASTLDAGEPVSDGVKLEWRGKKHATLELPHGIPRNAIKAITHWEPWAVERGYTFALTEDGRVLLVSPKRAKTARSMKLITKTCAEVDAFAPVPARGLSVALESGPLTEASDRESVRVPDDVGALDRETVVLLDLANKLDQRAVLDYLAGSHDYLESWAATEGAEAPGFVLLQPLCGAWLDDAPDQKDWDADNELVHRLTSLLLLRRFGPLPSWAHRGFCWRMEQNLRGDVDSFPGGVELTKDERGWAKELKQEFKGRETGLDFSEIAGLQAEYGDEEAALAWGTISFLAEKHPTILSRFFEDLRVIRKQEGIAKKDGRWARVAEYQVPAERQLELLEIYVSRNILEEIEEYFAKGRIKKKVKKPRVDKRRD